MTSEPAWRRDGPSEIIDAPDHRAECATEGRTRWYACSFCDHVRGYGQPYIFDANNAVGVLNRCPECLRFAKRHHDCTCDLIEADRCDYCHRAASLCVCP